MGRGYEWGVASRIMTKKVNDIKLGEMSLTWEVIYWR